MNQPFSNRFRVQIPDQKWFEENIGCENACPVNTRAPEYIAAIVRRIMIWPSRSTGETIFSPLY